MKPECILKVIKGSGRFLKKVLAALVMVLVSHSIGSSKLSFSDFFLSNPADKHLVTCKQIEKKKKIIGLIQHKMAIKQIL